jgi:hypothetical protein
LTSLASSLSARPAETATQGSRTTQQISLDSAALGTQSARRDSHEPEQNSNTAASSSPYSTPLTANQLGALSSFGRANFINSGPDPSFFNTRQPELNYDEMFFWPDSPNQLSEMDMTQVLWNGDQAMFEILASMVDSKNN